MNCRNCNAEEIEKDDNFCYKCGYPTSIGMAYINKPNNLDKLMKGDIYKQESNFKIFITVLIFLIILYILICFIRGFNMFRPIFSLNRHINSYLYGYNVSIIKTDNHYNNINVNSLEEANNLIIKDFQNQTWKCEYNLDILNIQKEIEDNFDILSVNLCDMSLEEVKNIKNVLNKMYNLFPNIKGGLTNISITNAKTNSEYIALFQPKYQFVNPILNIKNYNKVNKTQILLNSYYYLNNDMLNRPINDIINKKLYNKDATVNSLLSHELGHYINYYVYLKENNLKNITFETLINTEKINRVIKEYETGEYNSKILNEALKNYNSKYKQNIDIKEFANSISVYAGLLDQNGNINSSETIAEAIHDYYLHQNNSNKSSLEIVNIINNLLKG